MEAGRRISSETDILIIGGGPAGSAAAITAINKNLKVVLLEQANFPRHRPGETLHPGTEAILSQLGISEAVALAAGIRHQGINIEWSDQKQFQSYGNDFGIAWEGFQIERKLLDQILLDRAKKLGTEVHIPFRAGKPIRENFRVVGVQTPIGDIRAKIIIDASGPQSWSFRQSIINQRQYSPKLIARYGYFRSSNTCWDTNPCLVAQNNHWYWVSPISDQVINWTQVSYPNVKFSDIDFPAALDGLKQIGQTRGADVTWRFASQPANHGVISVGDAASLHDPLSSHGVLHALMSGIMASTVAERFINEHWSFNSLAGFYNTWLRNRFLADSAHLIEMYSELSPTPLWIEKAARLLLDFEQN